MFLSTKGHTQQGGDYSSPNPKGEGIEDVVGYAVKRELQSSVRATLSTSDRTPNKET